MTDRELLRHTLATLSYRAAKAVRDAPDTFADFRAGPSSRTPLEIVAHMGDLMDWGASIVRGEQAWNPATPEAWDAACARFFAGAQAFDEMLAATDPVPHDLGRLFQGPVADALTHTGQLTMLRRLHGAPVKGENYNRARIAIGRVGSDQEPAEPRNEFD